MPHNLTAVDEYTTNVSVPSGGDARVALSVEPGFQALANRTLNAKNRLAILETYASYLLSGVNVATKVTLTAQYSAGAAFSLASDEVTFPALGRYLIDVSAALTCEGTDSPETYGLLAKLGATVIGQFVDKRFSANGAHVIGVGGVCVANVTSLSDKLTIINANGDDEIALDTLSVLLIRRLS